MSELRRILLAELFPLVPQDPVYALLDSSYLGGANGSITGSSLVLNGLGGFTFCNCLADTPMVSGVWYWETKYTFPTSSDVAGAGIATRNAYLTAGLGRNAFDPESICGVDIYGDSYYSGNKIVDLSSLAGSPFTVRHLYDADAGVYQVDTGAGFYTVKSNVDRSRVWYPALQVYRNAQVTLYSDPSSFVYSAPFGAYEGVYTTPEPVETPIYISSEEFITGSTDTPASTVYEARIGVDQDLLVERKVSCWIWKGSVQSSRGQLQILNTDGALDEWNQWLWRDTVINFYSGFEGDTKSDFTLWQKAVVESIDFKDDDNINIALADPLATLDVAIQKALYPLNQANAQAVNKPLPILLGEPLFVPGVLLSTATTGSLARAYQVSDQPIEQMNNAYDMGDPFDPPPTDYDYLPERTGVQLVNTPAGKVCFSPSGGYTSVEPVTTPSNGGDFDIWSGGIPTPWTVSVSGGGLVQQSGSSGVQFVQPLSTDVALIQVSGITTLQLMIRVKVTDVSSGSIVLRRGTTTIATLTTPGEYGFISLTGSGLIRLYCTGGGNNVTLDYCYVDGVQQTITLEPFMKHLLKERAGKTDSDIDTTALSDLDSDAPYTLADYIDSSETILQVAGRVMDSYCGWLFPKLNGELTVGRLVEPSDTAVVSIDDTIIDGTVQQELDRMEGLSTLLAGGKNYSVHSDSDIVTSATIAFKQQLKADYLYIRSAQPASLGTTILPVTLESSVTDIVARSVQQANSADAQPTLIQDPDQLTTEIGRVGTLARKQRFFYTLDVLLEADVADTLEPGQTVELVYPRYGLDNGKNLLVIGVVNKFFSKIVTLTLWG